MSIQKYQDRNTFGNIEVKTPQHGSSYINHIIEMLQKSCGIGYRAAQKLVIQILQNKNQLLQMSNAFRDLYDNSQRCSQCNNIDISDICSICSDNIRDKATICVVDNIIHMLAIERSGCFNGVYHILFSDNNMRHITIDTKAADAFIERLQNSNVKVAEVVLALDGSLNGEVLMHYILDMIPQENIKVTRLASGIPIGADLEYMDSNTLGIAINTRHEIIR
jgi:recombination protein RecR